MMTIRCSTLPRALSCPASLVAPKIEIGGDRSEVARTGTAVHEALAAHVKGEPVPSFHDLAAKHDVDADQVAMLYHMGVGLWRPYADTLKILAVEHKFEQPLDADAKLRGSGDIIAEALGEPVPTIVVWDWKTGSPERDHSDQLIGYAWLANAEWRECEAVKIVTAWVRGQFVEIEDVSAEDMLEWRKRFTFALEHPKRFNPTATNCQFCHRQHECPARTAVVARSVTDLTANFDEKTALSRADLAALVPKAKLLEKVLEQYYATLQNVVQEDGFIPIGDGREVGLETRRRRTVRPLPFLTMNVAWDPNDLARFITINKSKLCKFVGEQVECGKGKAIEAFMERLSEAGAIAKSCYQVLTVRKIRKES